MMAALLAGANARHVVESSTSTRRFCADSLSAAPPAKDMVTAGALTREAWPLKHVSRMEYADARDVPFMAAATALLSAEYTLVGRRVITVPESMIVGRLEYADDDTDSGFPATVIPDSLMK
ncbi:Os02g0721000 [Oryza sativa Japonica Group]|uniref:Os02g0721000 protein n=1 Tax=Oryza sativa subsp. japonica TaxID=39947 RepID=Q0DY17_ORYSJ|nr:Os02g0721000 [Oryza sativa Japonica Group]|eukprot:NP_001047957.1 Os02g0721000 [Oryza sativa Japonica Group]